MTIAIKKEPCLNIEYVAVSTLKPEQNNPRKHSPKQIETLARAIGEFGFSNPILVDADNIIIAGHARLDAAVMRGMEMVPTIRLEHLTPAQIKAYRIADNKLAELSEWDESALRIEFKLLSELDAEMDFTLTGFELPKIDMFLNPIISDTEVPEPDVILDSDLPPVTKSGDVWVLGNHRIICGDSLKAKTYAVLMGKEKADVVFTDPPYNVPIHGHVLVGDAHQHEEFAMAAGEMTDKEFSDFLSKVIKNLRQYSRDGSIHYICMDWRHIRHLLEAGQAYSELKNICVWNKSNGGMGSLYRSKHELVAVFKHGTERHVNNIELGKHGRYRTNVWDYSGQSSITEKGSGDIEKHPTPKPVSMIADALQDCSNMHDIVLDVFGGSGSTLMAAERVQRKARLIEIEPHYVDVTVRRWQEETGQHAVFEETGEDFDTVLLSRKEVVND